MEPSPRSSSAERRSAPGRLHVTKEQDEDRVLPHVEGLDDQERNQLYESAKKTDYEIPRLQALAMPELMEIARAEGVEASPGLARQELIFQILKRRATNSGLGWAEGVLDILPDGFGFLRSRQYSFAAGPDDIYVSPSQIRRLNLKQGHQLAGPVRPPKEGEKYFALLHVEAVNGGTIETLRRRIPFDDLTPLLPDSRLRFAHENDPTLRVLDLLAPIGKGQRVLLLMPPGAGRIRLLTQMTNALLQNHAELYAIVMLVDARPEEVTETSRRIGPETRREVVASTFDDPPSRHVALTELVLERARRAVEAGRDVVLVADSLTSLTRAYNVEVPHSGKILASGLDAASLHRPKKLFGSARRVEEGGSLTVIATALTDTGSRINDVIVEEFAGKANCEIVFDKHLAELHVVPALDVARTGTRSEDNVLPAAELAKVRALRRRVDQADKAKTLEGLLELVTKTKDNAELLAGL